MYKISNYLEALGNECIVKYEELNHLDTCRIKYLECDKKRKSGNKKIYADCHKVPEKEKAICNIDFIITFYHDSFDLSDYAKEILMFHELLHVGYDGENCYTISHDLEDFKLIINTFGTDWVSK